MASCCEHGMSWNSLLAGELLSASQSGFCCTVPTVCQAAGRDMIRGNVEWFLFFQLQTVDGVSCDRCWEGKVVRVAWWLTHLLGEPEENMKSSRTKHNR